MDWDSEKVREHIGEKPARILGDAETHPEGLVGGKE